VLHDYSATDAIQLSFQVGDLITIISKAAEGQGQWARSAELIPYRSICHYFGS